MIYGVYSMRDSKTGFTNLSLDSNDDSAVRNFTHALTVSDGLFQTFPQDFALLRLGSFDTDTGIITPVPLPVHLVDGAQVLRDRPSGGASAG